MHKDTSYSVSLAGIDCSENSQTVGLSRLSVDHLWANSFDEYMTNTSRANTSVWTAVGVGLAVGWLGLSFNVNKMGWRFGERQTAQAVKLSAVDIRPQWESAWVQEVIANDPAVKQIVSGYLSGLSSAGYVLGEQGVWVSTGQYTVAQNQGDIPMPAASLTKVATTLAALSTWEAAHRFETWVG